MKRDALKRVGRTVSLYLQPLLQMHTRTMKNQRNLTPPKEQNKAPVTGLKEMEVYEPPDK